MKRQRGRGRKSGNPANRSLESNGPEVKIRGTAAQIYEKYVQYARDAQTSGDRVKAENLLQHAEHYYRLMAANAPAKPRNDRDNDRDDNDTDAETENADNNNVGDDEQVDNDPLKVVDEADASSSESDDNGDDAGVDGEEEPAKPRRRNPRRRKPSDSAAAKEDKEASSALDALAQEQAAIASN